MKRLLLPICAALVLAMSAVGCCHRSCYDPSVACNCGTWQPLPGGWSDCCHCQHPWSPGPCCGPSFGGGCGCGCQGQPCGEPVVQAGCGCGQMPCAGPVYTGCGCGNVGPVPAMQMQPTPAPTPAPPVQDGQTTQYQPGAYYQTQSAPPAVYPAAAPQLMSPGYNYNMSPVPMNTAPVVPTAGGPQQQQWVPAQN